MTNFENSELEVNGFEFNSLSCGPVSGDLVLFLHGFPEFGDAWRDVMTPIAQAAFHTVAVDQRGYSNGARPSNLTDYGIDHLLSDISGFADTLGRYRFHLVGHNWGAFLAWTFAAKYPDRIQSLTALSTPHPNAFLNAMETDEDQKRRSQYISFFKAPNGVAESFFMADNYQRLRMLYQGRPSEAALNDNVRRLAQPGALTAVLNWYRALDPTMRIEKIEVPTLYIWSTRPCPRGSRCQGHARVRHWTVPIRAS